MKAFKGCVNPNCKDFKKAHYNNNDLFCKHCGQPLEYVCAKCWKVLDTDKNRLCERCEIEREKKRAEHVDSAKNVAKVAVHCVVGAVPFVMGVAAKAGIDKDKVVSIAGEAVKKVIKK